MLDKLMLGWCWLALIALAGFLLFMPMPEQAAPIAPASAVHTAWPAHYALPGTATTPAPGWTCWHGSETYAVVPGEGPQVWVECRGPSNELIAGPGAYRIVKREADRDG